MQTVLGFVLAMSITMVLIPLLARWAEPLQIIDMPEARKVHSAPVPRVGGIAMVLGVLVALLVGGVGAWPMQSLMIAIAILLCFGVWDDRRSLAAAPKFAGQAIAALVLMLGGGLSIATVTLADRMALPAWLAWPLTFLFLLGGTNAFNLADGLDGLAGGMAMLCLCGTALLAFTAGNGAVGAAAVIMVGALVGFLRFNTHPARVFMGDGGSQVLGLFVAVLAIMLTQDRQIPFSTALPLLLLGVPIIDTLMVMTERLLHGHSPFKADRGHVHHRLLALGFQHWEAVSILYLAQACFLVTAWYLRYASDLTVGLAFVLFSLLIILPIRLAQHLGLHWRAPESGARALPRGAAEPQRLPLRTAAGAVLAVALGIQALSVLLFGAQPSQDVRLLALGLGALLTASLLLRWRSAAASWLDKGALYSCAALAIFLGKMVGHRTLCPPLLEYMLFPVLALALAVWMRTTRDRAFRLTPLDILVLVIVFTIPNLPGSIASARSLGVAVAELVLLFYGLEALCFASGRHWRWLSGAAAAFLFALVLRAGLQGS